MSLIKSNVRLRKKSVLSLAITTVGLACALLASTSHAAKFGVKVIDDRGQAVAGAAVCFGLPGSYQQFGVLTTDASGLAMMDVPNVPLVVTITKTRFSSMRVNEPARGFNLIKEMTLSEGTPGPRCKTDNVVADNSMIKIANVDVMEGAFSTTLTPRVAGEPTQYRVSQTPSFSGAKWQRFESSIALTSNMASEEEIYLQMRRYTGTSQSWIEARSEVVTVKLPVFQ